VTNVVVGYCSGEQIDAMFMRSMIRLLAQEKRIQPPEGGIIHIRSGPRIASARNQIVRDFLHNKPDAEWLLMLDTDMTFASDLVERMLNAADPVKTPILGALCFGGGYTEGIFPTMYKMVGDTLGSVPDVPDNQLVDVDATGAACLLVHRSVYEAMIGKFGEPQQWFVESVWNGREIGEDISFCLRAKLCGFTTRVHTGIHVGHARTKVIGINDWNEAQAN
jgi:hypothetical protein